MYYFLIILLLMKKFLFGFAAGVGVSVAAAFVYQKLLHGLASSFRNWSWDDEYHLKPYRFQERVVGIQFGNVVFALHDAPAQLNFDEAWAYCENQKIGDKKCCLPMAGLEETIPAVFDELNKMLVSYGGEPLRAVENNGYWATGNCEKDKALAWIVAFHKNASDYYDRSELAYVRPVIVLEEEF